MKSDKELYRRLRHMRPEALWNGEVPRFEGLTADERDRHAALIRAVGVVFSESGTREQKAEARSWMARLLKDPSEKIRRYAVRSLPGLDPGKDEEEAILSLLRVAPSDRERKYLGEALEKIGGKATLDVVTGTGISLPMTEQRVKANLARKQNPCVIRMDRLLSGFRNLSIRLHCRKGLEEIVTDEAEERLLKNGKFRIAGRRSGLVAVSPAKPFSLSDIYSLRCFSKAGFFLGSISGSDPVESADDLAMLITSQQARSVLNAFTEGQVRYRIEITGGRRRSTVRMISERAYAMCPDILNDPTDAPWSVDIITAEDEISVELRADFKHDPRFLYREGDIGAASHPPLAASMARLAGSFKNEIVWDPFCGSGLELIERSFLAGVGKVIGTDISPEAIAACKKNFKAAGIKKTQAVFKQCDFRDFQKVDGLHTESISLIITNPPMGRRIRIPDLRGLIRDLFATAEITLKPGGRLVFPNPVKVKPYGSKLRLEYGKSVDLGGFTCRLEMYVKK